MSHQSQSTWLDACVDMKLCLAKKTYNYAVLDLVCEDFVQPHCLQGQVEL